MPGDGKRPEITETGHAGSSSQADFNFERAISQAARSETRTTRPESSQQAVTRLPEQVRQEKLQELGQVQRKLQKMHDETYASLVMTNTYEDRVRPLRVRHEALVNEIYALENQMQENQMQENQVQKKYLRKF